MAGETTMSGSRRRKPRAWRWHLGSLILYGSVMEWDRAFMLEPRRGGKWAIRQRRTQQLDGECLEGCVSEPVTPSGLLREAEMLGVDAETFLEMLEDAGVPELDALSAELRSSAGLIEHELGG